MANKAERVLVKNLVDALTKAEARLEKTDKLRDEVAKARREATVAFDLTKL